MLVALRNVPGTYVYGMVNPPHQLDDMHCGTSLFAGTRRTWHKWDLSAVV